MANDNAFFLQSLMASLRLFRRKINSSSFLAVSLISSPNVVWRGFMSFCDFKVFLIFSFFRWVCSSVLSVCGWCFVCSCVKKGS